MDLYQQIKYSYYISFDQIYASTKIQRDTTILGVTSTSITRKGNIFQTRAQVFKMIAFIMDYSLF